MIQPHSLLIQFNDPVLIALRIYLLIRRKTTTSQGLAAGALRTGLPEKPLLLTPLWKLRALMWECGLQMGWDVWKGREQGAGGGAQSSEPASWAAVWSWGNIIWCDPLFSRHHLLFLRPTESPSCKRHTLQIRAPWRGWSVHYQP